MLPLPASNPANAAPTIKHFFDLVMIFLFSCSSRSISVPGNFPARRRVLSCLALRKTRGSQPPVPGELRTALHVPSLAPDVKSKRRLQAAGKHPSEFTEGSEEMCGPVHFFTSAMVTPTRRSTLAFKVAASKMGGEQVREVHTNAAARANWGYSTSGFGNLPSFASHHSRRL